MENQNQKTQTNSSSTSSSVPGIAAATNYEQRIVDKIKSSEDILVALSRDPSVDEMAAAIGLTIFLDSLDKHTTAIYSGQTPDALEFLRPDETFEANTDSLQDFIIALSKEKADHLRYKLEGDFVKVYITPYKTVLSEGDLDFSHGDYNVDLVLAIGVPSAGDLDAALVEYGRIMHDATTVDITCDAPGRFAEIEWSDTKASSVSEMVAKLIFKLQGEDAQLDKDVATALLTGIVAATGRFSNDRTNPNTMELASKLMSMGADQQLISAHVVDNDANNPETAPTMPMMTEPVVPEAPVEMPTEAPEPMVPAEPEPAVTPEPEPTPAPTPDPGAFTIPQLNKEKETADAAAEAVKEAIAAATAEVDAVNQAIEAREKAEAKPQVESTTTVTPIASGAATQPAANETPHKDYSAMVDAALAEAGPVVLPPPPTPPTGSGAMPPSMPPAPASAPTAAAEPVNSMPTPAESTTTPEPGAFRIPGIPT